MGNLCSLTIWILDEFMKLNCHNIYNLKNQWNFLFQPLLKLDNLLEPGPDVDLGARLDDSPSQAVGHQTRTKTAISS